MEIVYVHVHSMDVFLYVRLSHQIVCVKVDLYLILSVLLPPPPPRSRSRVCASVLVCVCVCVCVCVLCVCVCDHGLRSEKLQHNHGHTPTVDVHGCKNTSRRLQIA